MIHGIECGNVCQQYLGRANITVRLFPTNMLFSRLQCHAKCLLLAGIHRHADYASRYRPLVFIFSSKIGGMWPAITQGNSKALRGSCNYVGAHFSWWLK